MLKLVWGWRREEWIVIRKKKSQLLFRELIGTFAGLAVGRSTALRLCLFIHSLLSFLGKSYFGLANHDFQAILINLIKFNFLQANIIIIIVIIKKSGFWELLRISWASNVPEIMLIFSSEGFGSRWVEFAQRKMPTFPACSTLHAVTKQSGKIKAFIFANWNEFRTRNIWKLPME